MKYIITQHARQRRSYKEVESADILTNFSIELDILFNSVDEIMDIVHIEDDKYMLNDFKRRKGRK